MSKPKFCLDCKHHSHSADLIIGKGFYQRDVCTVMKHSSSKYDLVTGAEIYKAGDAIVNDCAVMRKCSSLCGEDARYFEVK